MPVDSGRLRPRRVIAYALAAAAAACGNDPVAPDPTSDIAGTYIQRTFGPDWWSRIPADGSYDPARTTQDVTLARDGSAVIVSYNHFQASNRVTREAYPSRWTAGGDSVSVVSDAILLAGDTALGLAPLRVGLRLRRAGTDTLVGAADGFLYVRLRR